MSHSIAPQDTRPILTQNPRLSDDDPIAKAQSVPNPPVFPVPHDRLQGVVVLKKSK